ncbi:integral peroxisomal membrane peroxin-domain-containing protein [Mycotypha africana]|uniref:integral peroxisomal membrane peroxin-domain-containing protein n=1 Tax=Mycotypha africana TaxID=64632 RepID=UPI0022FFD02B|nr:integral peroxisomal membrane peroxin-domain-containing protein [Mycotypha africana]KAI8982410.1 integral peroxisomal membrane peroxin-domain-containing protein [Mycotypha africana]
MSHSFDEKTFTHLTYCDKCKQLLWGLRRQGLQCRDCGYNCHHSCQKTAAKCSIAVSQGFLKDSKKYLKRLSQHNRIESSDLKRQNNSSSSHSIVTPLSDKPTTADSLNHLMAIVTSKKFQNIVLDAIVDNPIPNNAYLANQPPLNPQASTINFTRFVSRCGPVFAFRDRLLLLLSWNNPIDTFVVLLSYSIICIYPKLLFFIPQCAILYFALTSDRNKATVDVRKGSSSSSLSIASSLTQDANKEAHNSNVPFHRFSNISKLFQPAMENSPEYLRNLQNLQNNMGEFSDFYDWVLLQQSNYFNWSSEKRTIFMLQALLLPTIFIALALYFVPVRLIFLISGLSVFILNTRFAKYIINELEPYLIRFYQQSTQAWLEGYTDLKSRLEKNKEIIHEVSIFESQIWCPSRKCYLPLQDGRLPLSTSIETEASSFPKDIAAISPPDGYQWKESSEWAIDTTGPWVDSILCIEVAITPSKEGWVYSDDHGNIFEPREGSLYTHVEAPTAIDANEKIRRRRWFRSCEKA